MENQESTNPLGDNWKNLWEAIAIQDALARDDAFGESNNFVLKEELRKVDDEVYLLLRELGASEEQIAGTAADTESNSELEQQLAQITSSDPQADLEETKKSLLKELTNLLKLERKAAKADEELTEAQVNVQKNINETREAPLYPKLEKLKSLRNLLRKRMEAIVTENPLAFVGSAYHLLRTMKRQFKQTGVMITPHLEQERGRIFEKAASHLNGAGVVALLGPTGTGKTVMARHLAQSLNESGAYQFVPCHSRMLPDDLMSRMTIAVSEGKSADEVVKEVENALKQSAEAEAAESTDSSTESTMSADEFEGLSSAEKKQLITKLIAGREQQKVLVSKRVLEAALSCAKEGTPLVLDEFNYLPPETLASLNALMGAHEGDEIAVGEETVTVKKGFCVILTGNIGREYARKNLDPAFINRIGSNMVEYGYLPQETMESYDKAVLLKDRDEDMPPAERDMFLIALAQMTDKRGNLRTPASAPETLWNLSRAFSIIQLLGAGKKRENVLKHNSFSGASTFGFSKWFLSFRNFNEIIRSWASEGYQTDLSYYLYDQIVRPALLIAPREAAQLFYVFKHWGGFFQDEQWDAIKVNSERWEISEKTKVEKEECTAEQMPPRQLFSPTELAQMVHGRTCPEFQTPAVQEGQEEENRQKFLANLNKSIETGRSEVEAAREAQGLLNSLSGQEA